MEHRDKEERAERSSFSKPTLSARLALCAELLPVCDTVADVGTDHGYLGIALLQSGKCRRVIAADLREKPLASARANAARCGVADRMRFLRSDGLREFAPRSFDTLVLAGMGGDLIARILAEAPWLETEQTTLILQPQSAVHELRRFLGERRYEIAEERPVRDGRFLYSVMRLRPGRGGPLTPGEQYVSPALRASRDPLYPEYLARVRRALALTLAGIARSRDPADASRADYFRAALTELSALDGGRTSEKEDL